MHFKSLSRYLFATRALLISTLLCCACQSEKIQSVGGYSNCPESLSIESLLFYSVAPSGAKDDEYYSPGYFRASRTTLKVSLDSLSKLRNSGKYRHLFIPDSLSCTFLMSTEDAAMLSRQNVETEEFIRNPIQTFVETTKNCCQSDNDSSGVYLIEFSRDIKSRISE